MAPSVRMIEFQFIIDRECESFEDSMVEKSFNDEIDAKWPLDFHVSGFDNEWDVNSEWKDKIRYTAIHNKDVEQIRVDVRIAYLGRAVSNVLWKHAVAVYEDVIRDATFGRLRLSTSDKAQDYWRDLIKTLLRINVKQISSKTTFIFEKSTVTIKKKEVKEECRTTAKKRGITLRQR